MSWINRDDLIDWLHTEEDEMLEIDDRREAHEASYIRKHVMEMPKEDVKPVVHAHWVPQRPNNRTGKAYTFVCSNCKKFAIRSRQASIDELGYVFCPNCGAKMEE